ncbi:MAG: hypothetical protein P8X63_14415 [Desulfuromonadaceae bacterium]
MSENKSFFQTLPGILTGLAAVLSAVTGLYLALRNDLPNGNSDQGVVELSVESFSFDPMPPTQDRPVIVTSLVRNSGNAEAKEGEVEQVSFNYPGYRSWYGQIETKVTVNPRKSIVEQNYENNALNKKIPVLKDRN